MTRTRFDDDVLVFGDPIDPGALEQIRRCRATADRALMMADHHLGYAVPIGGVLAYRDAISPSGVGYDIGCGNKAVLTDAPAAEVRANIATILDDLWAALSFGMGRKNQTPVGDLPVFDNHHNFAWQEEHDGESFWVVRKGATPAFPGHAASSAGRWAT